MKKPSPRTLGRPGSCFPTNAEVCNSWSWEYRSRWRCSTAAEAKEDEAQKTAQIQRKAVQSLVMYTVKRYKMRLSGNKILQQFLYFSHWQTDRQGSFVLAACSFLPAPSYPLLPTRSFLPAPKNSLISAILTKALPTDRPLNKPVYRIADASKQGPARPMMRPLATFSFFIF